MSGADTFPKLLLENAARIGDLPACREKDLGIWQTWSWSQVADEIRALACGLAAMGFQRGDKLIIVGDNRPRLYWAMTAAQAVGGVPVPVYQDSAAQEMAFVVEHAEARFALAEDQEQVDKLLEIRETVPRLEQIIYEDSRGLRNYGQDFLHSYETVQEMGREYDRANPGFHEKSVAEGKGADTSVMLYTSGTTGKPKGVVLTHDNVMRTARNNQEMENLSEKDEILAYLPMAWVGDHIFSFGQNYTAGFCVNCPESAATVMQDLRDIGPTYFFAPPRIFENILTTVMVRMEDAAPIKRRLFHYFMDLAQRAGTRILDGKPVPAKDRLLYWLGNILVY
ncbi:MAG: AMP-binding protein, partial [Pseudomonadota bacterium]